MMGFANYGKQEKPGQDVIAHAHRTGWRSFSFCKAFEEDRIVENEAKVTDLMQLMCDAVKQFSRSHS